MSLNPDTGIEWVLTHLYKDGMIAHVREIDEELEGFLFDLCVTLWEQIHQQPSVRYTALRLIFNIAARYPELKQEIDFLTGDHYLESLSPGVRNAVERMRGEHFPAL